MLLVQRLHFENQAMSYRQELFFVCLFLLWTLSMFTNDSLPDSVQAKEK